MEQAPGAPWLHAEVARRMAERLSLIKFQPALVVDWQSRLGGGLSALRAAYPAARLQAVEGPPEWTGAVASAARPDMRAAPEMAVDEATRAGIGSWWSAWRRWRSVRNEPGRAAARGGASVRPDDVIKPSALTSGQAGLVWANMVLQGHPDPPSLFEAWHRALAVDGFLMFSTLGPGSLGELRTLYAEAGWGPPMAPLVDMHDLGDMLVTAGFADPVMDQEQIVLTWPDAAAALDELRQLGGNADVLRHRGCRTPRWRLRLVQALEVQARRRADGRVALTFEIAYGHAFKPAPRVRLAPESRVGVDQMRQMLGTRSFPKP